MNLLKYVEMQKTNLFLRFLVVLGRVKGKGKVRKPIKPYIFYGFLLRIEPSGALARGLGLRRLPLGL